MRQSCSEAGVSFQKSSLEKELPCLVSVGTSVPGLVSMSKQLDASDFSSISIWVCCVTLDICHYSAEERRAALKSFEASVLILFPPSSVDLARYSFDILIGTD